MTTVMMSFIDRFSRKQRGDAAETEAAKYLQKQGLTLLERNFNSRWGEIDIICRDGESLVFIEVRLRQHDDFGGALASIDERKQQRLRRTAESYLQRYQLQHLPCRFDVVALKAQNSGFEVQWLTDAF